MEVDLLKRRLANAEESMGKNPELEAEVAKLRLELTEMQRDSFAQLEEHKAEIKKKEAEMDDLEREWKVKLAEIQKTSEEGDESEVPRLRLELATLKEEFEEEKASFRKQLQQEREEFEQELQDEIEEAKVLRLIVCNCV